MRIEHDSMGAVEVPTSALWGAQTQRALMNFSISGDQMPLAIIHALARIKQAAAKVNRRLGVLDEYRSSLICTAASEVAEGLHDGEFPLTVWQSGSGTQTNMNLNEVISNLSSRAGGEDLGSHIPVHPNDHVNRSQSTNDTFPAAINIATANQITKELLPELQLLIESFNQKSVAWNEIIKVGRTHLQDAVPLTLGQEASAWRDQLLTSHNRIKDSLLELYPLPLGGTAVGTSINSPCNFDSEITKELSLLTELPLKPAINKFAVMASHDGLVNLMTQLKMLAVSLIKIVNDIRLLACGPRAGLGELKLPENEPGSSIMPGKVNPTQCESIAMICTQILGLDTAVAIAGSGGHLQMNSYKPLIAFNLINTIEMLKNACHNCRVSMVDGIQPNLTKINRDLNQSLMLVTALTPKIGYEKSSQIAQYAYKEDISLREAALKLDYIKAVDFDRIVDPSLMTMPNN